MCFDSILCRAAICDFYILTEIKPLNRCPSLPTDFANLIDSLYPLLPFVLLFGIVSVHRHDSLASLTWPMPFTRLPLFIEWSENVKSLQIQFYSSKRISYFQVMLCVCLRNSLYLQAPLISLNLALITIDPRAADPSAQNGCYSMT